MVRGRVGGTGAPFNLGEMSVTRCSVRLADGSLFRFMDRLTADFLLPLVALLTAVLVGWRLRPEILRVELSRELDLFFALWQRLLRYIAPLAIAMILIAALLGLLA